MRCHAMPCHAMPCYAIPQSRCHYAKREWCKKYVRTRLRVYVDVLPIHEKKNQCFHVDSFQVTFSYRYETIFRFHSFV